MSASYIMLSAIITNMIIGAGEGIFKIYLSQGGSIEEIRISNTILEKKENLLITDSLNAEFIADAAVCNKMEIQAALLALEKAQTSEIKTFAAKLKDFHERSQNELKKLAFNKHLPFSDELSPHCKDDIGKLFKLNGQLFEKTYLNLVEENQKKSLAIYKKVITRSTDADIRAFAFSVIPELEAHNASVKLLNKTLRTTSKL